MKRCGNASSPSFNTNYLANNSVGFSPSIVELVPTRLGVWLYAKANGHGVKCIHFLSLVFCGNPQWHGLDSADGLCIQFFVDPAQNAHIVNLAVLAYDKLSDDYSFYPLLAKGIGIVQIVFPILREFGIKLKQSQLF